jgi:hypothetical protein
MCRLLLKENHTGRAPGHSGVEQGRERTTAVLSLPLLSLLVKFKTLKLQFHPQIEENNDHGRGTTATKATKSQ